VELVVVGFFYGFSHFFFSFYGLLPVVVVSFNAESFLNKKKELLDFFNSFQGPFKEEV